MVTAADALTASATKITAAKIRRRFLIFKFMAGPRNGLCNSVGLTVHKEANRNDTKHRRNKRARLGDRSYRIAAVAQIVQEILCVGITKTTVAIDVGKVEKIS